MVGPPLQDSEGKPVARNLEIVAKAEPLPEALPLPHSSKMLPTGAGRRHCWRLNSFLSTDNETAYHSGQRPAPVRPNHTTSLPKPRM